MPVLFPRREFLSRLGAMAAATITASPLGYALLKPESLARATSSSAGDQQRKSSNAVEAKPLKSPFRVSVINDEISQDFGRACEVASREFGMRWIELRVMWNKNILHLDSNEVAVESVDRRTWRLPLASRTTIRIVPDTSGRTCSICAYPVAE